MTPISYHRRITDRPRRGFSLLRLVVFVPLFWWLLSKWVDAGGGR